MRQNGISVVRTRKHKVTTDSDHKFNIAPNLLDRNFMADQPNQKWAGDISYVWTREGWLYLAVILDLHSRRVIGWAVSNRMKRDLAIRALKMAIAFRQPPKGCIHHTDRGSQYCSHDYQKLLRQHGFKVSPLAHVNIRCRAADVWQRQLLRLNRGGNRQANAALYRVAIVRMRSHAPTLAYVKKRTKDGKSKSEIIRCLKRYIVREIYRQLCVPKTAQIAT